MGKQEELIILHPKQMKVQNIIFTLFGGRYKLELTLSKHIHAKKINK